MVEKTVRARSSAEINAEEDLVIDVQFLIQELLEEKAMTRTELAEAIGITRARLSQLMSSNANPNLRNIARIFAALNERLTVDVVSRKAHTAAKSGVVEGSHAAANDSTPRYESSSQEPRVETGAEADRAYMAIEAKFNRSWTQDSSVRASNDSYDVIDELLDLAAA